MKPKGCLVIAAALIVVTGTTSQSAAQSAYLPFAFTNFAGAPGVAGSLDGNRLDARFNIPSSAAVDTNGNVYVAEYFGQTVRRITPLGDVTTLAGSPGQSGTNDGTGSAARFKRLSSLAVDGAGLCLCGRSGEQHD